ncbi:nuclear protein Es2 [Microdochium bolleyi]|uniref:Nuclear protein Es2 n=1 Tax=Microdochium bolleyi TaxID=196109 RepID=A0A136J6B7_9PEZI|nr:nuclear protein Es2 [Microdochium bolleyi]
MSGTGAGAGSGSGSGSGSPAPSSALVRKRTDLDLMPPPQPPAKRIKRPKTVIDEDSYTEALSHIIARDFFPGLLESETQQEYLDALDSKDAAWIASASRRLQHVMTPGRRKRGRGRGTSLAPGPSSGLVQTPRTFVGDTPVSVVSSVASTAASTASSVRAPEVDTDMSLGAFQAKYTSEDNESFYKLLDRQNSKRAEKYAWLWAGNKLPSKMQLKQREVEARLLESRSLRDDGFKKDRLAIKDKEERPAQCDTWKSAPQNALMFVPAGVEDNVAITSFEKTEAESRAPPRAISYQNTRLPQLEINAEESVPSSPSLSAVRDAIAGKRTEPRGSTSTAVGNETPRVNGYAFVDDEEPAYDSATPLPPKIDLGPGDASPNPFLIKAQPSREALHYRMVDRIHQSRKSSSANGVTGKVDKTPVPKFPSSPRVGSGSNFTPAAQRLWSKIGNRGGMTPKTPFGDTTPMKRGSKLKQVAK